MLDEFNEVFAGDKNLKVDDFNRFENASVIKHEFRKKRVVGFCAIEDFNDPAKQHVGRLAIGVLPEFRGNGIGKLLLNRAINTAFWQGKTKIWLTVYADNIPAIKLYEQAGFKVEGVFRREEFDNELGWRDVYSMALFSPQKGVVEDFIEWGPPQIGAKEVDNILSCVYNEWYSKGPQTASFVSKAQAVTGFDYVIPVTNGTMALVAVFKAMFEKDDLVIMPNYTFIATYNAARIAGLTPVLVDVDKSTGMINLLQAENYCKTRKIAGIVSVAIGGMPSDYYTLSQLKEQYGIKIIEDAAAGLGAESHHQRGDVVDAATYSLHVSKVVTSIEGGLIATNNPSLAYVLNGFTNHGERPGTKYRYENFGLNLRITDLHMAVADAQIDKLTAFINRRNRTVKLYREILGPENFQQVPDYVKTHPYMFCLYFVDDKQGFMSFMINHGVDVRPAWYGIKQNDQMYPNSYYIGQHGVYLPLFNGMSTVQTLKVIRTVKEWLNR